MTLQALHDWFIHIQRDFPWRKSPSAYMVWVSEIMLQQTRANVVVPFFLKFMEKFPNLASLANAPLEEVIKAWEGLGYYRRAKNLHQGAKVILKQFDGIIPNSKEKLLQIPGIGSYTAGAILNFAFFQKAPAIDGNVLRVLSRYCLIEDNIDKTSTKKVIEEKAFELLDHPKPWIISEALIELGALICLPKPSCLLCPLKQSCKAFHQGNPETLPIKNPKEETISLIRAVFIFQCQEMVFVHQVESGKVMEGLYEFPYDTLEKSPALSNVKALYKDYAITKLPIQKHTFTKYRATLYPFLISMKEYDKIPFQGIWVDKKTLAQLPFSSGHRKIKESL